MARSDPLFGYYFAPVWGTIVLMARPGKPQYSSGRIPSGSSNPPPSSAESDANLTFWVHPIDEPYRDLRSAFSGVGRSSVDPRKSRLEQ